MSLNLPLPKQSIHARTTKLSCIDIMEVLVIFVLVLDSYEWHPAQRSASSHSECQERLILHCLLLRNRQHTNSAAGAHYQRLSTEVLPLNHQGTRKTHQQP